VPELSKENLVALCSLEGLHGCFLSESVGATIVQILNSLAPRLDLHSRMITDRDRDVVDLKATIERLGSDHAKQIAVFEQEKGKLLATIDGQKKTITGQEARIATLEQQLDRPAGAAHRLEGELRSLQGKVRALGVLGAEAVRLVAQNGAQPKEISKLEGDATRLAEAAAARESGATSRHVEIAKLT
jgi:chromosome segregation ATPase